MGAPTDVEKELIEKLRENVADLGLCEEALSGINLVRWLRARNHNLKDGEAMFRDYIKWSDEFQLQSIFEREIPKRVTDVYYQLMQPVCGLDHDGSLLVMCNLGEVGSAQLARDGFKKDILAYGIKLLERNAYVARCFMAERPKNDCYIKISSIIDCGGLDWSHYTSTDLLHTLVLTVSVVERCYPEILNKIVIVNAPAIFKLVWAIVKPFFSEHTLEKMQIYGKNRQQWQEAVYKVAPKESLPKRFGGILPDDFDILPKFEECVPRKRGSY